MVCVTEIRFDLVAGAVRDECMGNLTVPHIHSTRLQNPTLISPNDFHNNEHIMLSCIGSIARASHLLPNWNSYRNLWHRMCFAYAKNPLVQIYNALHAVKSKRRVWVRTLRDMHSYLCSVRARECVICLAFCFIAAETEHRTDAAYKIKRHRSLCTQRASERTAFDTYTCWRTTARIRRTVNICAYGFNFTK